MCLHRKCARLTLLRLPHLLFLAVQVRSSSGRVILHELLRILEILFRVEQRQGARGVYKVSHSTGCDTQCRVSTVRVGKEGRETDCRSRGRSGISLRVKERRQRASSPKLGGQLTNVDGWSLLLVCHLYPAQ